MNKATWDPDVRQPREIFYLLATHRVSRFAGRDQFGILTSDNYVSNATGWKSHIYQSISNDEERLRE